MKKVLTTIGIRAADTFLANRNRYEIVTMLGCGTNVPILYAPSLR